MSLFSRWPALSRLASHPGLAKNLSDIGQLLLRNVFVLGFALLATSVLTSTLSREEYGIYQFALGIASGLSFISLTGLNQAVMQETAKGRHGVLLRVLPIRLRASAVFVAVLLAVAGTYQFISRQPTLALCMVMVSLTFPLTMALDSYQMYLLGRGDYVLYARLPMLMGLIVALVTALTAWVTRGPAPVLFAVGMAQIMWHLAARRVALKRQPPQNQAYDPDALRFGMGLSVLNIVGSVSSQLDTLLTGTLLSMSAVAVLNMARMPLDKSGLIIGALGEFLGPRVVSQSGLDLFRKTNRAIWIYLSVLTAYAIAAALIIPLAFQLFFPKYLDVVPLAVLGLFSMLPSAPTKVINMAFSSQHRLRQMSALRLIQTVFEAAVTYLMIRTWGVTGAILTRFLAGAVWTLINLGVYCRNQREAIRAAGRS